ncbi:efflux transporter periplasmic adaptor subunit [Sphingobacteriaceae bacterium]|nr:efflux transporter periplasmic adaptor subunit [Sphingobacteriaceae bacterium]
MKVFFFLAGLSLFIASCGHISLKTKSLETFPVTSPVFIDTLYTNEYVSDIHAVQNIELRARIKGYIEGIYVDEGQTVKEGEVLFRISSQLYKEELLKAKAMVKSAIAEAKSAELDLQNVKTLVEKNIVSKTELEMAKSKLDALNAKIEEVQSYEASAKLRLQFTEIKAPFNGIINRIPYKIGSLIDEGTLLTTLSDNREVFAYFHVSEKEYLDFAANLKDSTKKNDVTLILANNSVHPYVGTIETIEGEFDNNTGSIAIRARFPNKERILKHGSSGKILIKRSLRKALVVPQKSTFEIQDRIYVFVVDSNNKVSMKSITAGLRLPHLYVVQSGLTPSDKIIYEGIQEVKDGAKINSKIITMREIIAELEKN